MAILNTPEFWVAASFVGFILLIMYFKVPGQVARALDKRADDIKTELDQAKQLHEEARAMLAEYERKHRDAEKEAQAIVKQAQADAESLAAETRENLKGTLERRAKLAEDKIARAEEQAIAEVRASAISVAIAAAEQIIDKKMTPAASKNLVDDSIKSLKSKLN